MRINMTTEITSMSGMPVTNAKGEPMTVREALFLALETNPMEKDASGSLRPCPPTMPELMKRIELGGAIKDDEADLTIEQVAALKEMVRMGLAVAAALPVIAHLEG
ncbi:hypothetical protein [Neorhizobium sp. DAR64872/K0K18]|uniref:hypothetical protein n=1 Tax=Neorhizobium sp. DAR64872/K0K18 TaxID=3421958 RepID=UPI003D288351